MNIAGLKPSVLTKTEAEKPKFICPACGGTLGENNLPDLKSVVTDNICDEGNFKIIHTPMTLKYLFLHGYNEEEDTELEESHLVFAYIELVFDDTGDCIMFNITGVAPCSQY